MRNVKYNEINPKLIFYRIYFNVTIINSELDCNQKEGDEI